MARPADAVIDVPQPKVTLTWAAASGPVSGYAVYAAWNGAAFPARPNFLASGTRVSLTLRAGDTVRVRVAAHDAAMNLGPLSQPSPVIRYAPFGSPVASSGAAVSTLLWKRQNARSILLLDPRSGTKGSLPLGDQWDVATSGDFNGDGFSDLLLRSTQNLTMILWMQGTNVIGGESLASVRAGCGVAAVASFDGDASDDIVWRCDGGYDEIWLFAPGGGHKSVDLPRSDPIWSIKGAGDINGDGRADLVWQQSTSGAAGVWLMQGATLISAVALPATSENWQIVGIGDFNGDGQQDLLWQNVKSLQTAVWLMAGTTFKQSSGVAVTPRNAQIHDVTDVDGDGRADVIWAEPTDYRVWFMNGVRKTRESVLLP